MDVKLHHCFLAVDDHDKAIAFCRDALGLEVPRQPDPDHPVLRLNPTLEAEDSQ